MVDQINQSINVVVPLIDNEYDYDDNAQKIIEISQFKSNQRPLYLIKQNKHLPIIRQQLKAKNRLLLKAYKSSAYYSCHTTELKEKVLQHMTNTNAYVLIMDIHDLDEYYIETYFNHTYKQITKTLKHLLHDRSLTYHQWQKMRVNQYKIRFDHLYFLPDIRQENVPFQPMMDCHRGLTIHISRFLSRLLQPIYDRITRSKTFMKGADAIYAVEKYARKGLLQSNTLFATLHILDLSTIISHEQIIEAFQRFLHEFIIDGRVHGITIQNIIDLVRLFLENQYFLYEYKLYAQIKGSSYGSPLTMILANIYIYYWQQDLVKHLNNKNEIFGRYLNQIFLTWNETEDNLRAMINTINHQYPDIQMTILISQNINYLDAQISHTDGDLIITMAHDIDTEPYTLPFIYGHRSNNYSKLIRAALLRTVQCYLHVYQFHNEIEQIQLTFLLNGFSSNFINQEIQLFFSEFDAEELKSSYDQTLYDQLRQDIIKHSP